MLGLIKRRAYSRKLKQSGDTIVEVMISMAILALALSIAYSTSSSSLQHSRNAEEHSQALEDIQAQTEALKAASQSSSSSIFTSAPTDYFCMDTANISPVFGFTNKPPFNPADLANAANNDQYDNDTTFVDYPSGCINGAYHISVSYSGSSSSGTDTTYTFTVYVRWDGPGDLGLQKEELNYELFKS